MTMYVLLFLEVMHYISLLGIPVTKTLFHPSKYSSQLIIMLSFLKVCIIRLSDRHVLVREGFGTSCHVIHIE